MKINQRMSITSNLVYNYAPSMTSCSSVYLVDEEIELWPPSPSIEVILRPRGGKWESGAHSVYVDCVSAYSNTLQFNSLLNLANLTQHVSFPTHRFNHTLDLVITQTDSTLCPVVSQCPISHSDHYPILYSEYPYWIPTSRFECMQCLLSEPRFRLIK